MNDFRFKVFVTVARELSFTKASRELHISQPAISKHIVELETMYGVQLFERKGSGVNLTVAGERLYELAIEILQKYREIEIEMGVMKGEVSGELKVGASTTIAQYVIAEILAKFVERFKDVKVSLISGNSEQIETALQAKSIDIGLVEGDRHRKGLHYEKFAEDELVLVTGAKTKISDVIDVEKVKYLPFVLRESGSGTLEVLERALERMGIKIGELNVIMQLGSTESIKQFLINSKSFAFVSIVAVAKDLLDGRLKVVDVEGLEVVREFSFISALGSRNEIVERFIEFAKIVRG